MKHKKHIHIWRSKEVRENHVEVVVKTGTREDAEKIYREIRKAIRKVNRQNDIRTSFEVYGFFNKV